MGRDDYLDHDSGDRDYSVEGGIMIIFVDKEVQNVYDTIKELEKNAAAEPNDFAEGKQIAYATCLKLILDNCRHKTKI